MAKVLVVDDDAGIRAAVRRTLVAEGHEVWDVPTGGEALPLLDTIPFAVVVTDVFGSDVRKVQVFNDELFKLRFKGHADANPFNRLGDTFQEILI